MPRIRIHAMIAVSMLSPVPPLSAQVPDNGAGGLSAFVDSVRTVTDRAALEAHLATISNQRDEFPAAREARKGWIAFRLGELDEGRARLDDAIRYFDEAVYRDGKLAIGWVGLAETKLLLEQRGAVVKQSMHQSPGDYYEDAALRHLAAALRIQPNYAEAIGLLTRLLVELDSPAYPDQLAESIRLAANHPENGPIPQLLLGRYLRKRRELPAARRAFERFLSLDGDPGAGAIEISRILLAAGQRDSAVDFYLRGATLARSFGRSVFRRDLAWFASPAELQTFDQLPDDSIGPWVHRLWARRDAADLRPEGERLAEHLRRWWFVQDHFQLTGRRKGARFGWGVSGARREITDETKELGVWAMFEPGTLPESDPRGLGVDDRGAIYLRHGEPASRVSAIGSRSITGFSGGCGTANESWKYDLPTGPIVLHFCASEALGAVAPTTLVAMLPLDPAIMGSRADLDTRFGLLELDLLLYRQAVEMRNRGNRSTIPRINPQAAANLRSYGRASIKIGLTTDTYPLEYERDLQPTVQIYGSAGSSGRGAALIVFALRGDRITPQVVDGRLVYPVKMRVTAVDTAAGLIRSLDTLRMFLARDTLGKESYLFGTVELPLPSGSYFVRTLIEQPGVNAAGAVGRSDVAIPGQPGRLTMSDLIPGIAGGGLTWVQGGQPVPLNPLNVYRVGSSLELYYQVLGTQPQTSYAVAIDFVRLTGRDGRGKNEFAVSFREQARDALLVFQRTIGLNELGMGKYLVRITVTEDGSGQRVSREMVLNVIPRN